MGFLLPEGMVHAWMMMTTTTPTRSQAFVPRSSELFASPQWETKEHVFQPKTKMTFDWKLRYAENDEQGGKPVNFSSKIKDMAIFVNARVGKAFLNHLRKPMTKKSNQNLLW
jgi:hypothetical protein